MLQQRLGLRSNGVEVSRVGSANAECVVNMEDVEPLFSEDPAKEYINSDVADELEAQTANTLPNTSLTPW